MVPHLGVHSHSDLHLGRQARLRLPRSAFGPHLPPPSRRRAMPRLLLSQEHRQPEIVTMPGCRKLKDSVRRTTTSNVQSRCLLQGPRLLENCPCRKCSRIGGTPSRCMTLSIRAMASRDSGVRSSRIMRHMTPRGHGMIKIRTKRVGPGANYGSSTKSNGKSVIRARAGRLPPHAAVECHIVVRKGRATATGMDSQSSRTRFMLEGTSTTSGSP